MKPRALIVIIALTLFEIGVALAFVGQKNLSDQCRDAEIIGRFKAVTVEKIEGAKETDGPLEVALVEIVEIYKGQSMIKRSKRSTQKGGRILVLQTYSYDDSPDGFDPGQEAIVFLDHVIGPYYAHHHVDSHLRIIGDRVRSQYASVPLPNQRTDPEQAKKWLEQLPTLTSLIEEIKRRVRAL